MSKDPTLFGAVENFLGPLLAEYAMVVEEGRADMPVTIMLGDYEYKTTLADIKMLDDAHQAAFDAKCAKRARKAKGSLL